MTRFITPCAAIIAKALSAGNALAGSPLTLTVTPLSTETGELHIALYGDADTWLGDDTVAVEAVPFDGPVTVTFPDVAPGTYTVAIFLDQNQNKTLDTALNLVPQEPYGFSNGSAGAFGPASFAAAAFTHGETAGTHTITLGHWPMIAAR